MKNNLFAVVLLACLTGACAAKKVNVAQCFSVTQEAQRVKCYAAERGLPKNSTWADITRYDNEVARRRIAHEMGLPETATWKEITDAVLKK